ncbi:MAG: nickel-responsive transcriptional regulator NikR [Candidatus Thorarchaeota archaeon]|nr:nickel-responsive transcriptional regulator NikR [Candidatus Thorarchaeota archaeon]
MTLQRFGVSVPEDLLNEFDAIVEKRDYVGRSEAIRDAMRQFIAQWQWENEQEGRTAALNIVYEHQPRLMAKLIEVQHSAKAHVLSTVHIHLTERHCFEILSIEGKKSHIQELADKIAGLPGIVASQLFVYSLVEEGRHHH